MGKANQVFFHPNDGRGSALRIELHYQTETTPGHVRMTFARERDGGGFDFDGGIPCNLEFEDMCEVVAVVRGINESVNGGVPKRTDERTYFAMRRVNGEYILGACRRELAGNEQITISLRPSEALGLAAIFDTALFFVAFIKGVNP